MSKRNGIVILKFFWKEMNNGEYDSKYHKIVSWCSSTCGFWWEWKYEYLPRYQWLSRLNDKLHVVKDAALDFMRKVIKFSHFFSLLTWMQSLLRRTVDYRQVQELTIKNRTFQSLEKFSTIQRRRRIMNK